jgi:hypothetical protein
MKIIALFFTLTFVSLTFAQEKYWQQEVSYKIKAELNDMEHSISGEETITYKNNSDSKLEFIWFHLWANAYKDETTALMQQIKNDTTRSKKAETYAPGWMEGLDFKVNGEKVNTEAHSNPQYIDIVKVVLNSPLEPGQTISISTPFKVILPPYFSRSGYADGQFMACQWYPKPAVFDKNGWHEFPYLDMGEFYSEYADYDVELTVPSDYIVGATGTLMTKAELDSYKTVGAKNAKKRKKVVLYKPVNANPKKTLEYSAHLVPDFAWFADKNLVIQYDTVQLPSGKVIDAFSYFHNVKKTIWSNSIDYVKDGTRNYSSWVGEYEYPVVQVVEGPKNNSSGGMEYPMITLITSPDAKVESLDAVIVHEVGHNWFMGMLGSNERDHAWMDEGLNTYYQLRYEANKYRSCSIFGDAIPPEVKKLSAVEFMKLVYKVIDDALPMEAAMDKTSSEFVSSDEYGLIVYVKTAYWMSLLEEKYGRAKVDAALKNYFNKWKHKHPQPEDMQKSFEEVIGKDLTKFFELTAKTGKLTF